MGTRENPVKADEILESWCMQNKVFTRFPMFAKRFVRDSSLRLIMHDNVRTRKVISLSKKYTQINKC